MTGRDARAVFAALTATDGDSGTLEVLCRRCLRMVAADGVSLTLTVPPLQEGAAAATDDVAESTRQLEFALGEGPGIDATARSEVVLVQDLALEAGRWPQYARAAQRAGVRAVFAFPLRMGAAKVGLLTLYRRSPGGPSATDVADALVVAEVVTQLVVGWQAGAPLGVLAAGLEDGALHRAVVHQATGAIAVQLNCGVDEALARLRAAAFAGDRPIDEVAADVLAGRLRLGST